MKKRKGKRPSKAAPKAKPTKASRSRRRTPAARAVAREKSAGIEVLYQRENYLVRRQRLAPGEASPWHRDPYHRMTVVISGDRLDIEFRDGGETLPWNMKVGEVDWVEPSNRVHRAVNVGKELFEEVTTFFLDRPDADPQPEES
jgi:quercetin dioxygenase-like cupin family protein